MRHGIALSFWGDDDWTAKKPRINESLMMTGMESIPPAPPRNLQSITFQFEDVYVEEL